MSLITFIVRRLVSTVIVLLLVMLGTFALIRGWGGNPFRPPDGYIPVPGPLQRELGHFYHLDDPWFVEYAVYVKHVFTFDFGPSMVFRSLDVTDVITQSFPVTLELVLLAAAWAIPLGVGLGVVAALRRNTVTDFVTTSVASVFLVVPVFFAAFGSRSTSSATGASSRPVGIAGRRGSCPRLSWRSRRSGTSPA